MEGEAVRPWDGYRDRWRQLEFYRARRLLLGPGSNRCRECGITARLDRSRIEASVRRGAYRETKGRKRGGARNATRRSLALAVWLVN